MIADLEVVFIGEVITDDGAIFRGFIEGMAAAERHAAIFDAGDEIIGIDAGNGNVTATHRTADAETGASGKVGVEIDGLEAVGIGAGV